MMVARSSTAGWCDRRAALVHSSSDLGAQSYCRFANTLCEPRDNDAAVALHRRMSASRPSRRKLGEVIRIVESVAPAHQPWPEPYVLPSSA